MEYFQLETSAGQSLHSVVSGFQDITLDKYRHYVKEIAPKQPPIDEDNNWAAPYPAIAEWVVEVCACFSSCPKELIWKLEPVHVWGGNLEDGKPYAGIFQTILNAMNDLRNYEDDLFEKIESPSNNAFDYIKGSFTHNGVEYFLPIKGFDDTVMEEFVMLQTLNEYSKVILEEKTRAEQKAKKMGVSLKHDEWDAIIGMLAVLAKPKIGGIIPKGFNSKEIEKREKLFEDIPVYLLKDIGFFLLKIADTTRLNSHLYSKAREVAALKAELHARQTNTSGKKQSTTLPSSRFLEGTKTKLKQLWQPIRRLFFKS